MQASAPEPGRGVQVSALRLIYGHGSAAVHAIDKLDLEVAPGRFVCVLGPSGSGKSSLLHVLGGLLRPSAGRVEICGARIDAMSLDAAARWRRRHLGMVHQFFNLIPTLTVIQNVALPLLLEGQRLRAVRPRVDALLERLGIEHRCAHAIDELSGGEMQRVAVARALVAEPDLLLADEPTGNLDTRTGDEILGIFRELTHERGTTLILVTHDLHATSYADRVVTLRDGRIVEDTGAVA